MSPCGDYRDSVLDRKISILLQFHDAILNDNVVIRFHTDGLTGLNDTKTAEAYITEVLKVPPNLKVESVVGIGYPAGQPPPHSKDELQDEKLHLNRYGNSFVLS